MARLQSRMARIKCTIVADLPNHFEVVTAMRGGIVLGESHISLESASNLAAPARVTG